MLVGSSTVVNGKINQSHADRGNKNRRYSFSRHREGVTEWQVGMKTKLTYSSVKRRAESSDRDRYDYSFMFSSANLSKTSDFTGKEYAAALSLVSLAILGPTSLSRDKDQPTTRRSKRIARRGHYRELDSGEWLPPFISEDNVAMGVPCVWAAMGYSEVNKATDSISTASDSAKSDFLYSKI